MNKKFLSVILFSALMVGTAGTFTSCKDYDDDIMACRSRSMQTKNRLMTSLLQSMANDLKLCSC